MDWQRILPVVVSILVIILVAIISERSKLVAAVTATMPLGVPLSLWIVYAAEDGDTSAVAEFTFGLFVGIIPTILFVLAAWLAAKAGWSLLPIIILGYLTWGVALSIILGLQQLFS